MTSKIKSDGIVMKPYTGSLNIFRLLVNSLIFCTKLGFMLNFLAFSWYSVFYFATTVVEALRF